MYSAVVFFSGPATQWGGKISDNEVIARSEHGSKWIARFAARSILSSLNSKRCGYVILKDGVEVEVETQQEVAK